jgi:hypothetical protein
MQVWVEFDGDTLQLNITLAQIRMPKPSQPFLSSIVDISSLILDTMYVGFSSSIGAFHTSHFPLEWNFKMNGVAEQIDYAKLPSLPVVKTKGNNSELVAISLPIALTSLLLVLVVAAVLFVRIRKLYAEIREDWELEYGLIDYHTKICIKQPKNSEERSY